MIFCDIDGTLINSNNEISSGTKQKIQELYCSGIPFILVSARMPSGILPLQRDMEIKAPIICYNGALILSEVGDCIKTAHIEHEKAVLIESFIKAEWNNVSCSIYCYNDWIVDNIHNDKWVVQEQNITLSVPTERKISNFVSHKWHAHKILCMGEAEQIACLNKVLNEKYPELSIYRSKDTYLEIMNGAASKSSAIKYLCKEYGISIESTVSFGDNFNDIDMFLVTGTSFAMGNAPEEVKRQAQNVTLDNDHDGVLAGLMQLNFK